MRLSRPVVTGVLVFTLEVGLTDICLNKVCMVVWTMSCTEMFLFKLFGLQGFIIIIYICWWTEDGGLRRKRTIILRSQNLTLYFMLQKQYRMHKLWNETLCVVWLRLTLQQLPAVCEKCYFPLAEARKKRKMFSHTLLGA